MSAIVTACRAIRMPAPSYQRLAEGRHRQDQRAEHDDSDSFADQNRPHATDRRPDGDAVIAWMSGRTMNLICRGCPPGERAPVSFLKAIIRRAFGPLRRRIANSGTNRHQSARIKGDEIDARIRGDWCEFVQIRHPQFDYGQSTNSGIGVSMGRRQRRCSRQCSSSRSG